jgi:hypothetical protein
MVYLMAGGGAALGFVLAQTFAILDRKFTRESATKHTIKR